MVDTRKKKKKKKPSAPSIGRHLSKLTGTGAKTRKAKIKGRGPVENRKKHWFWGSMTSGNYMKGSSIRTPRGRAGPETRSEAAFKPFGGYKPR